MTHRQEHDVAVARVELAQLRMRDGALLAAVIPQDYWKRAGAGGLVEPAMQRQAVAWIRNDQGGLAKRLDLLRLDMAHRRVGLLTFGGPVLGSRIGLGEVREKKY